MQLTLKNWKGDEFNKLVKLEANKRIEVAARLLENAVKVDLSEPSPPVSEPGDSPHKDTGRLRASISHEVDTDKGVARVGSNLFYSKWLELGTRFMAARPYLRKAFHENYDALMKILRGK